VEGLKKKIALRPQNSGANQSKNGPPATRKISNSESPLKIGDSESIVFGKECALGGWIRRPRQAVAKSGLTRNRRAFVT
jgi:hypothetical protein